MRKFHQIYKEKLDKANELFESKVLGEFKNVYQTLLEKYNIYDFYSLNEEEQVTFLAELNSYWSEEEGLSPKGAKFLQIHSDVLSEGSTTLQKRNYLKEKSSIVINETLRQSDVKWKIYEIIEEMYKEISASDIDDVLSPETIVGIIKESFSKSLDNLVNEIDYELTESAKEVELSETKKQKKT
jgi:hypothetical protein